MRKESEVGMTRESAIKHLEDMKLLLGVNNTIADGIPLTKVIDDIVSLLKKQEPRVRCCDCMPSWYCADEKRRDDA